VEFVVEMATAAGTLVLTRTARTVLWQKVAHGVSRSKKVQQTLIPSAFKGKRQTIFLNAKSGRKILAIPEDSSKS